jgi:hypothetical protein
MAILLIIGGGFQPYCQANRTSKANSLSSTSNPLAFLAGLFRSCTFTLASLKLIWQSSLSHCWSRKVASNRIFQGNRTPKAHPLSSNSNPLAFPAGLFRSCIFTLASLKSIWQSSLSHCWSRKVACNHIFQDNKTSKAHPLSSTSNLYFSPNFPFLGLYLCLGNFHVNLRKPIVKILIKEGDLELSHQRRPDYQSPPFMIKFQSLHCSPP